MILGRDRGLDEETRALRYFQRKGWKLLRRNYVCRCGELDLVLEDPEGAVVFMEVKYRKSPEYGRAQEAVDRRKQGRIVKAALYFIKEFRLDGRDFRFDVAALAPGEILHLPNAFSAAGFTL